MPLVRALIHPTATMRRKKIYYRLHPHPLCHLQQGTFDRTVLVPSRLWAVSTADREPNTQNHRSSRHGAFLIASALGRRHRHPPKSNRFITFTASIKIFSPKLKSKIRRCRRIPAEVPLHGTGACVCSECLFGTMHHELDLIFSLFIFSYILERLSAHQWLDRRRAMEAIGA